MKRLLAVLVLLIIIMVSREENLFNPSMPDFIVEKITSSRTAPLPESIWEYKFDGQKVYLVKYPLGQHPSVVYNSHSNVLCINDNDDSNKSEFQKFLQMRKDGKMIWANTQN